MKVLNYCIIVLVFTFNTSFSQLTNDLKAINNQVWENFSKAFETLDANLFASLHHQDFIRLSGNGKQIKYKAAYIEGYNTRWQDKTTHQTIIIKNWPVMLNRCQLHLALIKPAVKAAPLHQFGVFAGLNDATGIQDQNFVRISNRAQAVCNDQGSAPF